MIGTVLLMAVLIVLLVAGITLTLRWGGTAYRTWEPVEAHDPTRPSDPDAPPSVRGAGLRYLRGVALALAGGFWAGALVTGPAVRLIMRLLAVTAGDSAQGKITEAEEVVGNIDLGGTIGLHVFGGILPGLLSGALYVLIRRWLPAGRAAGVAFGAMHLVIAATRIDPLRPDNVDFDLVGPGWLAVLTFGAAAILHGMAVTAFVNRYSTVFPTEASDRRSRVRVVLPLVLPALLLIPAVFLSLPITLGLGLAVAFLRVDGSRRIAGSRGFLVAGRVALAGLTLVYLPGAVVDLRDIVDRPEPAVSSSR